VGVVVVDANDVPTLERTRFHVPGEFDVVHIVPEVDAVAEAVGRAPAIICFIGATRLSCSKLCRRPIDLTSTRTPILCLCVLSIWGPCSGLSNRDASPPRSNESTLDYYQAVQALAETSGASGGPLLQGGLLFRNPADDGGFYLRFWDFAVEAAASGQLVPSSMG